MIKKIVFYAAVLPIQAVMCTLELIRTVAAAAVALMCVLEVVAYRFEHWAWDVPHDYLYNTPYRWTLKQVWINAYNHVTYEQGRPTKYD